MNSIISEIFNDCFPYEVGRIRIDCAQEGGTVRIFTKNVSIEILIDENENMYIMNDQGFWVGTCVEDTPWDLKIEINRKTVYYELLKKAISKINA